MREKIQKAIETIRPLLQRDGGDIELVDVVDGVVKVRLKGACMGCPMSQVTLQEGVAKALKKEVPDILKVEAVN
ncbi:MAG: NifU family protein [Candidatus Omnitrophica bacterium]|nr:NifU family protein [Candidatus Omnitrophota bacterium]